VQEGRLKVTIQGSQVGFIDKGDYFGELALTLQPGQSSSSGVRKATVSVCSEECQLLRLGRVAFYDVHPRDIMITIINLG
jgi:CRP-like cAMP-binding protein